MYFEKFCSLLIFLLGRGKKNKFLNLKVNNNFLELKKMQSACSEMHS